MDFGSFREIARGSSLLYVEFCRFKNSLLGDCMRNSRGLFLALSLLISCTVPAQEPQSPVPIVPKKSSQQAAIPTPPSSPQITHSLDATDLGAFFDGIIPLQLERAEPAAGPANGHVGFTLDEMVGELYRCRTASGSTVPASGRQNTPGKPRPRDVAATTEL